MIQIAPRMLAATFILAVTTASAQTLPQPQVPATKPAEQAAAGQQPPKPGGQLANIKLELSLVDQRGDAAAPPKVVTMIVADRETGRIRTGRGPLTLNIDARADVPREGRIRVFFTLEYRPMANVSDQSEPMAISESLTVVLDDGKPMVVSQSADPGSDRKVRLELKATVLK